MSGLQSRIPGFALGVCCEVAYSRCFCCGFLDDSVTRPLQEGRGRVLKRELHPPKKTARTLSRTSVASCKSQQREPYFGVYVQKKPRKCMIRATIVCCCCTFDTFRNGGLVFRRRMRSQHSRSDRLYKVSAILNSQTQKEDRTYTTSTLQ